MKKIAALIVVFLAIMSVMPMNQLFAQQDPNQTTQQALSPQDTQKLRDDINLLKEVFGVGQPAQNKEQNVQPKKTMADVADRALDMVGSLVASTASTLQKVAPDVWRIMIRQQYAKIASWLTIPWGVLIVTLVYARYAKPRLAEWAKGRSEDARTTSAAFGSVIPTVICFASGVVGIIYLGRSMRILINPEYYAIRDLLALVMGPGSGM